MSNNDDISSDSSSDENIPFVFDDFLAADESKFIIFWREFLENNADSFGMFY